MYLPIPSTDSGPPGDSYQGGTFRTSIPILGDHARRLQCRVLRRQAWGFDVQVELVRVQGAGLPIWTLSPVCAKEVDARAGSVELISSPA